ncbi:uncharacterized protein DS421_9g269300 [Arachis hypogaea]|nr:uncharacterized protein DS421_9g269300 [Arachis hypogaea]
MKFWLNFGPCCSQEAALPLWRAGQKIDACSLGASVVRCCALQDAALPSRRAGQKSLVRQIGALVRCWCCRMTLVRQNDAAEPSLGAPEWCMCVHHQNAALPSRRAGQCFQK